MQRTACALVLAALAMGTVCYASDFGVSGYIGFGKGMFSEDDFEDVGIDDWDQPSYIPAGLQLTYGIIPQFQIGAEVEFCLSAFKNDAEDYEGDGMEVTTRMTEIGAFTRFLFDAGAVTPFLRGGFGFYSGEMEGEYDNSQYGEWDADINSKMGFNFGGGLLYDVSPVVSIGMEGVYHIVKPELESGDIEEDIGMNHLSFRALVAAGF